MKTIFGLITAAALLGGCSTASEKGTFAYDLNFLKAHKTTLVLRANSDQSQVLIVPEYQGRVMTSSADGLSGKSYGWLNYDLIAAKQFAPQINVFGGEDRFWMGPEGGQYSIFFKPEAEFTVENWNTPKQIDTEPFDLVEHTDTYAVFTKDMQFTNYQNFKFNIKINRKISILDKKQIEQNLAITLDHSVKSVAFESENSLTNTSEKTWSKDTGLLSIWILGMFNPSDNTTVIIPYRNSLKLNSNYFGEVSPDRLKPTANQVLFKADGQYRAKIGLPAENALPILGSYDAKQNILTIVEYSLARQGDYVNSLWEYQSHPYAGDVINAYNDGPFADGSQMGPFYELESSSATKALKPNEMIKHIHKTYHFEGSFEHLNQLAKKLLNTDLNTIEF